MKYAATALLLAFAVAANGLTAVADPGKMHGEKMHANNGRHLGQLRRLQFATLSDTQVSYALNHRSQAIARLRSMRRIDASKIRIVRLTAAQKARFRVSFASQQLAYDPQIAQILGGSNGSLIQQLQQIVAGMLVTNAINNTLGGSSGGGATATLAQILLSSGIPISDLLGVFFDPSGILNAIVG